MNFSYETFVNILEDLNQKFDVLIDGMNELNKKMDKLEKTLDCFEKSTRSNFKIVFRRLSKIERRFARR